ncbi:hypothetical protein DFH07DRAFT_784201 [Mycena maculata]|uniref:Uncharacterized protein n=1 Tax=Mycena maculata TaxID=230809 RepID=A0AAD7MK27_9AGAR|nr:hypothetical protein DFH07DRAFT_784201 [Mycena maculata]
MDGPTPWSTSGSYEVAFVATNVFLYGILPATRSRVDKSCSFRSRDLVKTAGWQRCVIPVLPSFVLSIIRDTSSWNEYERIRVRVITNLGRMPAGSLQLEPSTSRLSPPSRPVLRFSFPAATSDSQPDSQPEYDSQQTQPRESDPDDANGQPSVAALAALGIKARDFHYESTLPPIPPFRLRVPQQVQPSSLPHNTGVGNGNGIATSRVRPLKRTRRDGTEEEDLGYGFVMGVARARPEKLRRTGTDQILGDASSSVVGAGGSKIGFATGPGVRRREREGALLSLDPDEETALRAAAWDVFGGDSQGTSQQSQGYSQQSQSQSQGYSQGYYSQSQSQQNSQDTDTDGEPERLIATPLVTPNGSLQWIDGGPPTEPASLKTSSSRVQSRSPPPPQPGSGPAGGAEEGGRDSELLRLDADTAALPASPTPPPARPLSSFPSFATSSPLSSVPPSRTGSMFLPPTPPSAAPAPASAPAPAPAPAPISPSTAPRYQLRKRTAPASPGRAPKRRAGGQPRREDSLTIVITS